MNHTHPHLGRDHQPQVVVPWLCARCNHAGHCPSCQHHANISSLGCPGHVAADGGRQSGGHDRTLAAASAWGVRLAPVPCHAQKQTSISFNQRWPAIECNSKTLCGMMQYVCECPTLPSEPLIPTHVHLSSVLISEPLLQISVLVPSDSAVTGS